MTTHDWSLSVPDRTTIMLLAKAFERSGGLSHVSMCAGKTHFRDCVTYDFGEFRLWYNYDKTTQIVTM